MPFVSGNRFFAPVLIISLAFLACKGGARGRICVIMLILAVALGDSLVCNTLKHALQRPRPFWTLADVHIPEGVGRTDSGSMPSSHAANWFAATMVLFIYYRRSAWFMLPMALLVGFSRIYNGVHYPSDVLAGAILGAGYAAVGVWTFDALWRWIGRRWFPIWQERLPSLLNPVTRPLATLPDSRLLDSHWLRLAYVLIVAQMVANLFYLGSGLTDLTGDEAYQWIWSKHLALSYYSKPPAIAYLQFLGTLIAGDTVLGVRFFSPIIAAAISFCLLRFIARVVDVRTAFWLTLGLSVVPIFAVGSVLMTVDPPSVLFWTLAMIAGWRAIEENSRTADWLWVGLWMGLGFLSKYTALLQLVSWAAIFCAMPSTRKQLRRPGPWLALAITLVCTLPVVIWNTQRGWITVRHVAEGGQLDQHWEFTLANIWHGFTHYTCEFIGVQAGLQNPFFFLPTVWALFAFWRNPTRRPLAIYCFIMGASVFLFYFLLTFHSRVLPNWIVPSLIPFFCVAAIYWQNRWQAGSRAIKYWLYPAFIIGAVVVVIMHDTRLIARATGWTLPPGPDPTRRAEAWMETTRVVEAARQKLLQEGKPVFVIGSHYEMTGEITFHWAEARAGLPDHPLVYYQTSKKPDNQFYFWPGYTDRKGQNAIYLREVDYFRPEPRRPEGLLTEEFESITDLGLFTITKNGRPIRYIQMYECRNLR